MKIQCACGTKYAFDITPEMASTPILFVCQKCGVDSSALVNRLIREQLGLAPPAQGATGGPPLVAPSPTTDVVTVRVNSPAPAAPPAATGPVPVRVTVPHAAGPASPAATPEAPKLCPRHPGQLATDQCLVCQKPICPDCMEVFGYVCSALCKGRAEKEGRTLPAYTQKKASVEAVQWRKLVRVSGVIGAVVVVLLGVWAWYAWYASVPRAVFSVRFPELGYSGQCRLVSHDQVVFLQGGTLARHDLKTKKEIWSVALFDRKKIAAEAEVAVKQMADAREKARLSGIEVDQWQTPDVSEMAVSMEQSAESGFQLYVQGEGVWVGTAEKLVRYDWQTGKSAQEVPLGEPAPELIPNGGELLLRAQVEGSSRLTHVNLASGETRSETIAEAVPPALAGEKAPATQKKGAARVGSNPGAAAPKLSPSQRAALAAAARGSQPGAKPLDPAAVARQAQGLPLPNRLALPAVLAANANQERLLAEMRDPVAVTPGSVADDFDAPRRSALLPDGDRLVQFSVNLIESKTISRQAMKAPPKKSALDGDVNAAATTAVANEILNDMQRDRGGDVVEEDASRYQVSLRRPGAKDAADWTGEVVGRPELFPLQTVDVLVAAKSVWVFDKTNKKLWESKLQYPLGGVFRPRFTGETPAAGEGPVVERGDTLYLFDQGLLTAFDLATGNARWRFVSVGISGLHFDEQGMIYVNSSSQSPDILRYPNEIDISEKVRQEIIKLNAKTGLTAWKVYGEGLVGYVSGKFVYAISSHHGDGESGGILGVKTGLEIPPHIRIKRLDPGSGRVLWEHYEKRAPLDVRFEGTMIELLFKKELQVLNFFSL